MDQLLKKLNYKNQQNLAKLNVPSELERVIDSWKDEFAKVEEEIHEDSDFVIAFVKTEPEIEELSKKIEKLSPTAVVWIAYPKQSSQKYKVEINRDSGWKAIEAIDYAGVRQIALDEDWSALRFKPITEIKNFTRGQN